MITKEDFEKDNAYYLIKVRELQEYCHGDLMKELGITGLDFNKINKLDLFLRVKEISLLERIAYQNDVLIEQNRKLLEEEE